MAQDIPASSRIGVHLLHLAPGDLPLLQRAITEVLVPSGVNTLVLEVNYDFASASHPEVRGRQPLGLGEARGLARFCRERGVRLIPMLNCLGHQSWGKTTFSLLTRYPEFDETPQLPSDNPGIYCRSWCPRHPQVNGVVFALMDELLDAFEADAFHVGMDEVFLIASEQCPRCRGADPAEVFAEAINDYHGHLAGRRGVEMLMWGDRLLDDGQMHYGEWEASCNGTAPAIERIAKDIVICDWHYPALPAYPSVPYFQEKGFGVWPASWKPVEGALALIDDAARHAGSRMLGHLFTTWVSAGAFARALLPDQDHSALHPNAPLVAEAFRQGMRRLRAR